MPLEERTETIEVAGGDDVELDIRSTVHGPILSGLSDDFTAIADDPYTGTGGVGDRSGRRSRGRVRGQPEVDGAAAGHDRGSRSSR